MTGSRNARYRITHRTSYDYGTVVHQSFHVLRLSPRVVDHQTVLRHRLFTAPRFEIKSNRLDFFGNPFSLLQIESDHDLLDVTSESEIDVTPKSHIDLAATTEWRDLVDGRGTNGSDNDSIGVAQYTASSRHGRRVGKLAEYALPSFPDGQPVLQGAQDLTRRIFEDFAFDPTATDVSTPVEKVLELKRGAGFEAGEKKGKGSNKDLLHP